MSANSTNQSSPRQAGVLLRERLEESGWSYDDGRGGPRDGGPVFSECNPYTTLVGAAELGYDQESPRYSVDRHEFRRQSGELYGRRSATG